MRFGVTLLVLGVLAEPLAAQYSPPRTQWSLDVSPTYAGAITFARRLENSQLMWGLGTGFGWELNNHTFDRQFWNVLHLEGFARYQPAPRFQADVGLSVAASSPTDDTSEQRVFLGLYSSALIGHRFLFFGPQARLGFLDSDFGVQWNFAVRAVLPLGT